jgi:hypothetical protein
MHVHLKRTVIYVQSFQLLANISAAPLDLLATKVAPKALPSFVTSRCGRVSNRPCMLESLYYIVMTPPLQHLPATA